MLRLADLDLNLLVVLDVLLQERHVTRAAARLGTTQSTLSSSLGRLRVFLNDPLLVRTARGMMPTPRALALQPALRAALEGLSRAMDGHDTFDPATSRRAFVIAATDYPQFVLAGPLMAGLRREAPGVSVDIRPISRRFPWEDLATGELDLIVAGQTQAPSGLQSRLLFRDELVCLLRRGHPALIAPFDLESYLSLAHLEAHPVEGPTLADTLLARQGCARNICLHLPQFLIAPFVIMTTDLCFTVARRIAEPFVAAHPVALCSFPLEAPVVSVRTFWHPRMRDDPAHRWLREQLNQAVRA
ncbi:MAG: LysR family transcriptional regulator [Holophaga sp.]